jgi:hypothetical protein
MNRSSDEQGYVSSLAHRPHPLTPPGPQPSRWQELKAGLAWIAGSWRRPADADAVREQRAGREVEPS